MNSLEKRIENLTDEELQQYFEEIEEYNKWGMMGNTLVRKIRNKQAKETSESFDRGCAFVSYTFYFIWNCKKTL